MNRTEMIDMLMSNTAQGGELLAAARRRLWRMSDRALQRELLMRGLLEYEDPLCEEQFDEPRELDCRTRVLLGLPAEACLAD